MFPRRIGVLRSEYYIAWIQNAVSSIGMPVGLYIVVKLPAIVFGPIIVSAMLLVLVRMCDPKNLFTYPTTDMQVWCSISGAG